WPCAATPGRRRRSTTATRSRSSAPCKVAELEAEMHANVQAADPFVIAGTTIGSRLLLGTAGYPSQRILGAAVEASGCEIVTVSIRRVSLKGHGSDTVALLPRPPLFPHT